MGGSDPALFLVEFAFLPEPPTMADSITGGPAGYYSGWGQVLADTAMANGRPSTDSGKLMLGRVGG